MSVCFPVSAYVCTLLIYKCQMLRRGGQNNGSDYSALSASTRKQGGHRWQQFGSYFLLAAICLKIQFLSRVDEFCHVPCLSRTVSQKLFKLKIQIRRS